jgi:hypothetical protein
MNDKIDFKGYFKIQALDKNDIVLDEWEDNNMIMTVAKSTMSEIFANLVSDSNGNSINPFINCLRLGTMGNVYGNIINPKTDAQGFTNSRTRLFSETVTYQSGNVIPTLLTGDTILFSGVYYTYLGVNTTQYTVNSTVLSDTSTWQNLGSTVPYTYSLNFTLPKTNANSSGTDATNISETDANAGSSITVLQSGTSVTFNASISTNGANSQTTNGSFFTEAALYTGTGIFAMKTFKAMVKDPTVLLKIIWTITF